MQPGCRGGHTALDARINGLVGSEVGSLRLAVEIRRDGKLAGLLQNLGPGQRCSPTEADALRSAFVTQAFGRHFFAAGQQERERAALPFLQVAHQTEPFAPAPAQEVLLILYGLRRLQYEHLDLRSGLLMEMQAGLYHLRIVEHHERMLGQMFRDTEEAVFTDDAVPVEQQFGAVALGQRIFGYALIG